MYSVRARNKLYFCIFLLFQQMDKASQDNRAKQCNPTHTPTGPGHEAGYHGSGTKADLDNHSNQKNPNNPLYKH